MDDRLAAVSALMQDYADGLYRADAGLLGRVFRPDARYVTASGGRLVSLGMEEYLAVVAARTSPEARGEPRDFTLEEVEFAGPDTALARMRCRMLGRDYTDFLSLVRVNGAWRIAAKVFHADPPV